jgi:hypothetical protein
MASLRRTMTRTRTRARSRGNPNAHLRQRGKRAARPNIASMLTTVEWPTRLVSFSGRAFDDAAFPASSCPSASRTATRRTVNAGCRIWQSDRSARLM